MSLDCTNVGCQSGVCEFGPRCPYHPLAEMRRSADYEAARLDPTTDRDRWDAWDDGGLEGPGGDEW